MVYYNIVAEGKYSQVEEENTNKDMASSWENV